MDTTHMNQLVNTAELHGVQKLVVGAVIIREGQVLVLKRAQNEFMGGLVESPSGGVETGETLEEALRREVAEETGLAITSIVSYLGYFDYTSGSGKKARQFNFLVEVADGEVVLNPSEHSQYSFLTRNEVETTSVNITPETRQVLLRSFTEIA